MKNLIEKKRNGDPISNEELDMLIDYYSNLTTLLKEQGERGHIYWYYFFLELETLLGYKQARQR